MCFDFHQRDVGRSLSWQHLPIFMLLSIPPVRILRHLILTDAGYKFSGKIITSGYKHVQFLDTTILSSQGNILHTLWISQPVFSPVPCLFWRNMRKLGRFPLAVKKSQSYINVMVCNWAGWLVVSHKTESPQELCNSHQGGSTTILSLSF